MYDERRRTLPQLNILREREREKEREGESCIAIPEWYHLLRMRQADRDFVNWSHALRGFMPSKCTMSRTLMGKHTPLKSFSVRSGGFTPWE